MSGADVLNEWSKLHVMPEGGVTTPKGYVAGGLHCGIKRKRHDLGWIYSQVPAQAAGVFTTNVFMAPPLTVTKESIAVEHKLQAVLCNSGKANACTGEKGMEDAYQMRRWMAEKVGVPLHYTAVTSTGVIGEHIPMDKLENGIDRLSLEGEVAAAENFEKAILTTDTCRKHVAVSFEVDGKTVTIGGAAKGSGMIEPNMATMLGFVTTDAQVESSDLQQALRDVTDQTFNMITVDGDTSTNDMVLVMANGLAENNALHANHPEWETFVAGLRYVSQELAKSIARDGEGATKLIEARVYGAASETDARTIAKSIIGSSLVKSAVYGTDPNWGRIVCAAGYSGVLFDPARVKVSIGPITVVDQGLPIPFNEEEAQEVLQEDTVAIDVFLQEGQSSAIAWGCDLTYEYVRINATYRT